MVLSRDTSPSAQAPVSDTLHHLDAEVMLNGTRRDSNPNGYEAPHDSSAEGMVDETRQGPNQTAQVDGVRGEDNEIHPTHTTLPVCMSEHVRPFHLYGRPQYDYPVKILAADKSSEACKEIQFGPILGDSHFTAFPESHFWIEGPNGRHLALVLPVLGPAISKARDLVTDDGTLRKICRRMAEALDYFHSKGICHGDFRPSNILHRMHSIDSLTKHQIWRLLGSPFSSEYYCPVTSKDGGNPGPNAPRYAVRTADMRRLQDWIIVDDIAVVDFGVAFETFDPPQMSTGIPPSYSAPELLFGGRPSPSSDVWALACSILCLYTGQPLGRSPHDAINEMELFFGPLPEHYRQAYARLYKGNDAEDGSDDEGSDDDTPMFYSEYTWPAMPIDAEAAKDYLLWEEKDIQEKMKTTQEEDGYTDIFNAAIGETQELGGFGVSKARKYHMPRHEVLQLTDLLRPMFSYEPEERPDTKTILEHPWFATP
ncbi:kinase-like domain-containing protein [Hypoxylon cercidicola]|nr:kinase-like domain-containing protein [Hypoxylon cercidicola]